MRKTKNANMQKGLKKLGSKKAKVYVPKALESFRKYLIQDRQRSGGAQFKTELVSVEGLEKAVKSMPKEDKESIEKFWGLTGGVNHSEKMGHSTTKDLAFVNMRNRAHVSLRKLSRLEFVAMYYGGLNTLLELVAKKIDKEGYSHISDFESVKYMMAYLVIVDNGPKMVFEENPNVVETQIDSMCYLDEFQALYEMCEQVKNLPDKTIKLGLVVGVFEMMDLCDLVAVQQNFGLETPKEDLKIFRPNEIESIQTFGQIRNFKERVFKHGAWDVTCKLILGEMVEIQAFVEELSTLCRDWSQIENFKTGKKQLRTSKELLTLDVYNIGGLEFTDTYEIEFLYLMNQFI